MLAFAQRHGAQYHGCLNSRALTPVDKRRPLVERNNCSGNLIAIGIDRAVQE